MRVTFDCHQNQEAVPGRAGETWVVVRRLFLKRMIDILLFSLSLYVYIFSLSGCEEYFRDMLDVAFLTVYVRE